MKIYFKNGIILEGNTEESLNFLKKWFYVKNAVKTNNIKFIKKNRKKNHNKGVVKECLNCHTTFRQYHKAMKYCSDKCRDDFYNKRRRNKIPIQQL